MAITNRELSGVTHPPTLAMAGVDDAHLRLASYDDWPEIQGVVGADPSIGVWHFWARNPWSVPAAAASTMHGIETDGWIDYRIIKQEPVDYIIGNVSVHRDSHQVGYSLGYWVTADERRRGYATAAVKTVLDYAWTLGHEEVSLRIAEGNGPSQEFAKSIGATPTADTYIMPTDRLGRYIYARDWTKRLG
jgi:RimJ/RimL family protein N-acetyltransferase